MKPEETAAWLIKMSTKRAWAVNEGSPVPNALRDGAEAVELLAWQAENGATISPIGSQWECKFWKNGVPNWIYRDTMLDVLRDAKRRAG